MDTIRPESDAPVTLQSPTPEGDFLPSFTPGQELGGFKLIRKLGEGGMGAVYLAEDQALHRQVALKVMRPMIAGEGASRVRFIREARAAAQLAHDNIVPIHQVGEDHGALFLAMPFLRGESLGARLKREGRPPLALALKVARDVAQGLSAAHAGGIVHRDIKPDNIWLEPPSADDPTAGERAKILDFGLVRYQEGDEFLTRPGTIIGTPAYMSPEQLAGDKIDHRADLFSLGIILYQMTTGRRPFAGTSAVSILTNLATTDPPDPRSLNPDLPPSVSSLILRLLEKDPDKRVQTARDVVDTLRRLKPENNADTQVDTKVNSYRATVIEGLLEASEPKPGKKAVWMIPAIVIGLAALIGAGFAAYHYLIRPVDVGTVAIQVDDEATALLRKGNLRIYDQQGNTLHTFAPSEHGRSIAVGHYKAAVVDVKGLRVDPAEFDVEKDNTVTLRVKVDAGRK
jgi:serine/threonine protein kinase